MHAGLDLISILPPELSLSVVQWVDEEDLSACSRVCKTWLQVICALPSPRRFSPTAGVHLPCNPKIGELNNLLFTVRHSPPKAAAKAGNWMGTDPQVLHTDKRSFVLSWKHQTIECHNLQGRPIWSIQRPGSGPLNPRFAATLVTTRNREGHKTGQRAYFACSRDKGLWIGQWDPLAPGAKPSELSEHTLQTGCSQLWSGRWGIAALDGNQLFGQAISSKGKPLESFTREVGPNARVVGECRGQLLVRELVGIGVSYKRIDAQGKASSLAGISDVGRRVHHVYLDFMKEVIDPTNSVLFAYSSKLQPPILFAFSVSSGLLVGKWRWKAEADETVGRRIHSGLIGGRPAAILSAQGKELQIARLPKRFTTHTLPTESIWGLNHHVQKPLLPQLGIFLTTCAMSSHLLRLSVTNEGRVKAESVKIADPLWQNPEELFLRRGEKGSELLTMCSGALYARPTPTTQSNNMIREHLGPLPQAPAPPPPARNKRAMVAGVAITGLVWLLLYRAVRRIDWNQLSWPSRLGIGVIASAAIFPAVYGCAKS